MKNDVRRSNLGLGIYFKITVRQKLRQNKVSELNIAIVSGNPVGS